jgi:hypothetical protein
LWLSVCDVIAPGHTHSQTVPEEDQENDYERGDGGDDPESQDVTDIMFGKACAHPWLIAPALSARFAWDHRSWRTLRKKGPRKKTSRGHD